MQDQSEWELNIASTPFLKDHSVLPVQEKLNLMSSSDQNCLFPERRWYSFIVIKYTIKTRIWSYLPFNNHSFLSSLKSSGSDPYPFWSSWWKDSSEFPKATVCNLEWESALGRGTLFFSAVFSLPHISSTTSLFLSPKQAVSSFQSLIYGRFGAHCVLLGPSQCSWIGKNACGQHSGMVHSQNPWPSGKCPAGVALNYHQSFSFPQAACRSLLKHASFAFSCPVAVALPRPHVAIDSLNLHKTSEWPSRKNETGGVSSESKTKGMKLESLLRTGHTPSSDDQKLTWGQCRTMQRGNSSSQLGFEWDSCLLQTPTLLHQFPNGTE